MESFATPSKALSKLDSSVSDASSSAQRDYANKIGMMCFHNLRFVHSLHSLTAISNLFKPKRLQYFTSNPYSNIFMEIGENDHIDNSILEQLGTDREVIFFVTGYDIQ